MEHPLVFVALPKSDGEAEASLMSPMKKNIMEKILSDFMVAEW